jgi:putative methionine-R-sulfoxide reductase with GAF domain
VTDPTNDHDRQFIDALRSALASGAAADAIGSRSSPDLLLDGIVRAAARAIPCPEGALLLVDHSRRVLTFEVVIGSTAATVKDVTVPLGHGIAGLVAASGQALAVANAQEDPRHARDVAEQSGYLPMTILAVPVMDADGTPVGVLELLDRQDQPTFSLADVELLGMFADQVATVLQWRRADDILAAGISTVLPSLGGIPDEVRDELRALAGKLAARVEADKTTQRIASLAELVASIASRGPAEHELCEQMLSAVDAYLDTKPALGMGMFR